MEKNELKVEKDEKNNEEDISKKDIFLNKEKDTEKNEEKDITEKNEEEEYESDDDISHETLEFSRITKVLIFRYYQ